MRITIIQDDGLVGVDGVFRHVNLSELAGVIHAIPFDTEKGVGHIEYDRGATIEVDVRDEEAERAAERLAGDDRGALAALQPIYKKISVPRENERITDFTPYQVYLDRWTAAAPLPTPQEEHL